MLVEIPHGPMAVAKQRGVEQRPVQRERPPRALTDPGVHIGVIHRHDGGDVLVHARGRIAGTQHDSCAERLDVVDGVSKCPHECIDVDRIWQFNRRRHVQRRGVVRQLMCGPHI